MMLPSFHFIVFLFFSLLLSSLVSPSFSRSTSFLYVRARRSRLTKSNRPHREKRQRHNSRDRDGPVPTNLSANRQASRLDRTLSSAHLPRKTRPFVFICPSLSFYLNSFCFVFVLFFPLSVVYFIDIIQHLSSSKKTAVVVVVHLI